jgi:hypothetical protein
MTLDQGRGLMEFIQSNNKALIGVSDASVVRRNGRHAWMITSGDIRHIGDPLMTIYGRGTVGGHQFDMSSAQAELQGQTPLAIMTSYLVKLHQIPSLPITFYCDNKGILDGCNNSSQTKLCYHKRANMNLYMEYWHASKGLQTKNAWVKGHQDKGITWSTTEELVSKNPIEATLNIL